PSHNRRARLEGAKTYIRHARAVHQRRKLCCEGNFSAVSRTSVAETSSALCQALRPNQSLQNPQQKKSLIVAPRLIRFYPFWDCSEAKLASSSSVYNCGTRVIGAPRVLARECRLMPVSAAARLAQLALLVAMTPVPPPC